jgi:hypothetical protein
MSTRQNLLRFAVLLTLIASLAPLTFRTTPVAAQDGHLRADAVVLVNSASAYHADFQHFLQPYLDNFGIPYTVHDVATDPLTADAVDRALIVVGHNGLDETGAYLDLTEQGYISAAVSAGAGLVNFDRLLADASYQPRYAYVQDVLDLTYGPNVTAGSVEIGEGGGGYRINCWEDDHQDPVLTTTTAIPDLIPDDDQWTEFLYLSRGYPAVFAGYDESPPLMRFYGSVPDGEYTLVAHLYWSHNLRYYWGYTAADPEAYSFDVTSGNAGDFADYELGTVQVTGGQFELYVQNADPIPGGNDYPFYGWAWIRLVPEGLPPSDLHYITERHEPNESISVSSMPSLGMTPPADAETVATAEGQPFIVVRNYGAGKAVQWGSYAWMSHSVKGPIYGLDDLVWRSLVWAARKPFVMQGIPPFVTMRVDDESGGFWWIHIANEFGIKPWAGLFFHNIDATEAADLSALVNADQATTSIHAFNGGFFYFNHSGSDWPDATVAAYFDEGTQWHADHNIPISKFVLGHYYELGTNVFGGLSDWGVEFIGAQMDPGYGYGAPWIMNGPYRLYETGGSSSGRPMYYADFMTIPGHPEFDGQFFNCVTEIRDDAGYEWYPSNDVASSIGRGTRQTRRALDSMALATLFTHGQHVSGISQDNWRSILLGVTDNLAPYDPIYVTMDHACQYVRATHTSDIGQGEFDPLTGVLTTTLTGETDLPTQFYLFTECGAEILEQRVDVPTFSGSTEVVTELPGALHRIDVSPAAVTLGFGDQQQFTAQGYDVNDVPVVCADYTWDVVNGGGTIDSDGLFTAGTTPGTFLDTVTASDQGITGTATVVVAETPVDHFAFDPLGDQVAGVPFTIAITAVDDGGLPVTSYDGTATLTDTTGTIAPAATGPFVAGVWSEQVTINQAATGVVITAEDVGILGSSNPFTVTAPPPIPAYQVTSDSYVQTAGVPFTVTVSSIETTINLWEDDHQDPVLTTFTNPALLNDHDGLWDEFWYTSGRPYPTILAGHDEWENNGLQPMHFFASDIPNGRYEVWANLYTSRTTRHYFGFTEAEALAQTRWVDNVAGAGGSDQHEEYSLGVVEINSNRFDLWAGDGDVLSGTPYFYGWAWVRLEPALPETQFWLWEDAHQDPVLATTTSVPQLLLEDGQWTEFLYTPSRPYPSVMAVHDEWENNGLPPMRFYADGIPNGAYEVRAGLYSAAPYLTRYYYGFTEAEVSSQTRWVDNVPGAGGTEQHAEYSLGVAQITDGHFDLWAGDGDRLDSTSPYVYGWAWVRLIASGMEMTSSSPTMRFDGDGDGTFGEAGDEIGVLVGGTFDIAARDTTAASSTVITATDSAGYWGRATYTILPNELAGVGIDPPAASLLPYAQQQFTATGLDEWDNPIPDRVFAWDVVNGGGTIDADGLFTAGFTPGLYADTVVATTDGFSGTATVTVEQVPAAYFEFEHIYEPQYAGVPIEVIVTAVDYGGIPVTNYNGLPALSDTTGTIVPATIGPFSDGVWQGYVTISDVAADVVITADDGTASGSSNPFAVLAAPEHVYAVTSDSYVQVVGSPFTVTVAPLSHTINLWEDAHQRPVLATTTNAGDLVTTDGEWTEFHYVAGGRPFPSVMAGVDEEDYGLPTMHFYAVGIPNGTYEAIANLYTAGSGRDARYYYGFTPGDPKAHYVDTVGGAGGADQHEEYSLGEVAVTNGRFDLFVRDADLLGGTYPIFGWAHVRLVPVFPETRINLWEDAHQDPVLTTTTEIPALIPDDNEWTEFLYLSRGYPAVFAGYDESPPLMRFHAEGIPNGQYALVANLYWSHNLRYFWGYSAGNPASHSFDVTSGNVGDFAEYLIDEDVTVSDGTFELFVSNADPLPGGTTYLFYGWAWVRLVPTQITMSSSSATLQFDGDGDEVFGEPGDDVHLMTGEPFTTHAMDTTPGTGVLITATDDLGGTGVASYTLLSLDYIVVSPAGATLAPEATQSFTAQAYDGLGDPIPGLDYAWSVVNGGGTIDDNGLFTAGTTAGVYPDTVVASYAGVQGTASVTVTSGPAVELVWAPVYGPQYATVPFLADLQALDAYGNVAAGFDGPVDLVDTTGTLVPASVTLADGAWTGELRIDAVADDVVVSASDGGFSADTNPFDVLPAPEQSYDLFSESYVQTAGVPFTVTVTAISSTVNLWEDNHQRPVLATFTDPGLFNYTDGKWDEFHWVSRDYPAVFGGITEAVSETLEPMHFYAVVPNGTYRLIANLYRSNDYRYFYGFEPGDMRAHSVDVTSGPMGDFAEFELGTVTITDYRFNLYTDHADVILDRGAFPAFGWAWVRLIPTFEEILINCWEDVHQEPVLATTSSVGDLVVDDGEWTEFHYVLRDYPSVLAGVDEIGYGLPLMRFYAEDVPDGFYEVIANLYTSGSGRDMRYYYGFAPDEYLAHYVDTVGGTGGANEHTEYSLGSVHVTGGTFEIYVRDADLLAGTYPFFGWAWIRLLPTGLTMTSSSPTMRFDGDADGVFGEPDDAVGILVGGTFDIAARDTTAAAGVVITATDIAGNWGAATYTIEAAELHHIVISPDAATVVAGDSQDYTAEAFDVYDNSRGDVTAATTFSVVESGHGGSWADNVYTSHTAGDWTILGTHVGLTDTAALHVDHAGAEAIDVTPAEETVTAGESVTYSATATDAHGNPWDVTAATTFSIEVGAGGSWADNVYTSAVAGDWTVTGQYDSLDDTALLHVGHAEAVGIEVTPAEETVFAGGSVTYAATAQDTYGNTWDVTAGTSFSIEAGAGGSWADNVYTSAAAGDWTVTGQHGSLDDTALLHVEHTDALGIEIAPAEETVTAGESITYTATAEDTYGNTWDVTPETSFSIEVGAGGSWVDNVYTSAVAGEWTVIGNYGGLSSLATLHVEHAGAEAIEVTPAEETVTAGMSVTYSATATDAYANTWDVTASTAFTIAAGAGGSWADNVYTSAVAGDWTVTGQYDSLDDTALLHVGHAEAVGVEVTPAEETVIAGGSVTYAATARDAYGNTWDVTAETSFGIVEIGHGGTWVGNVYTSHTAGDWTVQGVHGTHTGHAQLVVEHGASTGIHVTPQETTVMVGDAVAFQVTAEDSCSNTWDVTSSTAFTIELGAGGYWVGNVYTSEVPGDWTVTCQCDLFTTLALLHVELYKSYLPLVTRSYASAPDLVVRQIIASQSEVRVVIANEGPAPAVDEFWVDVYIDPYPIPERVNQIWNDLCDEGLVWGVQQGSLPLMPGEALTLTIGDENYSQEYSDFSGYIPVGAPVYAQVDSANTETTYGGVLETHEIIGGEYNNVAGPAYPTSTLTGTPGELPGVDPGPADGSAPGVSAVLLPSRPATGHSPLVPAWFRVPQEEYER